MTTGKDYGLPEEYADWVEVPGQDSPPNGTEYIRVGIERYAAASPHDFIRPASDVWYTRFVPPKPKPTLPDVGPGSVVRWTSKSSGFTRRGTLLSDGRWSVAFRNPVYGVLGAHQFWSGPDLLHDVNADGFTVELEGLE